ncbi:Intersectin-2 [Armadillidium vulgare]|nr:Intersectin-2 [Armadillidium vulgare]
MKRLRQQDNTDKLEWMQRHIHCDNLAEPLIFNSLTNTLGPRKLLHMGLLHKAKSKKEIIAFLLSDFLLLTAASKPIGATTSLMNFEQTLLNSNCTMYKEPMFLSEIKVRVERDSETGFLISSPKCEISLSANSSNDRNNWLKRMDIAQKHIRDTEKSRSHSNQTNFLFEKFNHVSLIHFAFNVKEESDNSVVGRVLISVMGGVNLASSDEDQGRSSKGLLKVKQVGLKLDAKGKGNLHSFCEVSLGSQVHRTKTGNSAHPKWNQAMQFRIKSLSEDVLCITVFEKGFFRPNEFLGRVEVKIQSIYEKCGESPVPHVIRLPLQEVSRGEVVLKYSLQLFK